MTIEWYGMQNHRHGTCWNSPIGEMTVVRKHGSKQYQVRLKGVLIAPTLYNHNRTAQEAAEKYVRDH